MSHETKPSPASLSSGVRLAWASQSRRSHAQLSRLLTPHAFYLLNLAEGLNLHQQIMANYRQAASQGDVLTQDLLTWDELAPSLRQALREPTPLPAPWTLLVQDAETRGVYQLAPSVFAERAASLLRWDGNCLLLAAPNLRHGVLLDCEVGEGEQVSLQLERWSADGWAGGSGPSP